MEKESTTFEQMNQLSITEEGMKNFKSISKWATFLSILGFVYTGFVGLMGLVFLIVFPLIGDDLGTPMPVPMNYFGIFYILIAVIYFFPVLYLFRFSDKTKSAFLLGDQETFDVAIENLKKMFKFMGIMTIVMLSISVLAIPVAIIIAASAAM